MTILSRIFSTNAEDTKGKVTNSEGKVFVEWREKYAAEKRWKVDLITARPK